MSLFLSPSERRLLYFAYKIALNRDYLFFSITHCGVIVVVV